MDLFESNGWTDGLPIIPPTRERVDALLAETDRAPTAVIGAMATANRILTVETVAVNAVMAGCRPEYMPLLVAIAEALVDPDFNLALIQTGTNPSTPFFMVSGPFAQKIGMNSGGNLFGPGNRANATIGRAVRLMLLNVGGGIPGDVDRSTHGQPAKYTFGLAENEAANPWEPLRVELGYDRSQSTVTLVSAEGLHNMCDHVSKDVYGVLTVFCDSIPSMGMTLPYMPGPAVVIVCPEHAEMLRAEGWSKDDVRRYLYDHARLPLGKLKQGGLWDYRVWPAWFEIHDDSALMPAFRSPEEIIITVAGGAGRHSAFVSPHGNFVKPTTRIIADSPARA